MNQSPNQPPLNFSAQEPLDAEDVYVFTDEHLRKQLETAETRLGYKLVRFYVDEHGVISKAKTSQTAQFYLSPSGGTLRDSNLNLVLYSARYDMYKGIGRA
jgi:hypothetical protein